MRWLPRRSSLLAGVLMVVWIQIVILCIRYYHAPDLLANLVSSQEHISIKTVSSINWLNRNSTFHGSCEEVNSRGKYDTNIKEEPSWMKLDGIFTLKADQTEYFIQFGPLTCLQYGIDLKKLKSNFTDKTCPCLPGWHGEHCSIPDSVYKSNLPKKFKPKIRLKPRKIIQALPFNNEFEMLEARFNEIGQFVDVFMILESNYTAYGTPKEQRLLERLKLGHFKPYSYKILYVFLRHFPAEARKNGWIADALTRNYIGQHGVTQQLRGYDHDDIFFLTDADELPQWETILFLKVHDDYPIPIGINLRASSYGYFWTGKEFTHIIGVVTMGFLLHVFDKHAYWIRSAPHYIQKQAVNVNTYLKTGGVINAWSFGTSKDMAGWHCSWCCHVECIKDKLVSAQNGDFPRWGDYPAKRNLTYIRHLVKTGTWFDDVSKMTKRTKNDPMYAPPFIMCNAHLYQHLLTNIYE